MMRTLLIGLGLAVSVALLLGCEWTTGGNVDSWNTSQFGTNFVDFSGSYKAADGGLLVRAFGSATSTNQINDEQIGAGNGSATAFSGSLAHSLTRSTLTIIAGAYRFTDSGSTGSVGSVQLSVLPDDGTFGMVNYTTRAWSLNFIAPLASGTPILASYSYLGEAQGNHGKPIYSMMVYQAGNRLQLVDGNGNRYEGDASAGEPPIQFSVSGTSQGYKVTIVGVLDCVKDDEDKVLSRSLNATFIEEDGIEGDIKGVAQ